MVQSRVIEAWSSLKWCAQEQRKKTSLSPVFEREDEERECKMGIYSFSNFPMANYQFAINLKCYSFLVPFFLLKAFNLAFLIRYVVPTFTSVCVPFTRYQLSGLFPACTVKFSEHRQIIYQNAQNYILIIVFILICLKYSSHKTRLF